MPTVPSHALTDVQKIAVILSTLPDDQCVEVLKNYPEEGVERICAAMVSPVQVEEEARAQVLQEFSEALTEEGGRAGLETIEVDLPAVVTVDLRLNEPRFVKLPDIMKAKRKPLDVIPLEDLGVSVAANLEITRYAAPPLRQKGIMVENAAQLVQELKNRGLL